MPAASRLAWLLIRLPEKLNDKQRPLLAHLLQRPDVAAGYALAQPFIRILRERRGAALEDWLSQARSSALIDLRQFATALQRDHDAVLAAITLPWSNDPWKGM